MSNAVPNIPGVVHVLDKNYAYEHILYELAKLDIGKHRDMDVAMGKIRMVMAVMQAKQAVGSVWTAEIEDRQGERVVHLTWHGVRAGDADHDETMLFSELVRENAEAIQAIAQVTSC